MDTEAGDANGIDECPACMEKYDTEMRRPYMLIDCGHSLCDECSFFDEEDWMTCPTCARELHATSDNGHRTMNYALIDVLAAAQHMSLQNAEQSVGLKTLQETIDELQKKLDQMIEQRALQDRLEMECSQCDKKDQCERMLICFGCAASHGVDEEEADVADYIFCGLCVYKSHNSHKIVQYVPWKKEELVRTAAEQGKTQTTSMFELCSVEMDKGKELLDTFTQALSEVENMKKENCGLEDVLMLRKEMQSETTKVTDAYDASLGSLRRANKTVETALASLNSIRSEFEAKREPEIEE